MQLKPHEGVFSISKWAVPLGDWLFLVGERIGNDSQNVRLSGVVLTRDEVDPA
ncbi:hypothetical protein GCM10009784_07990 [Arthrobacter parietis]|uniref:Uncharacterized protein n=1 Tax=Arthrobacter parietis TaxID=271434 RepID=A0ABP5MKM5_9MICC